MDNGSTVQGTVNHILDGNKFPERMLGIKSYEIVYTYNYDGRNDRGGDTVTLDQLSESGLPRLSHESMGRKVTVHFERSEPARSILVMENYVGRGWLFFGFFAVIAIVVFCIGIKRYSDCVSGKTAVYINECEKKRYKRIKQCIKLI